MKKFLTVLLVIAVMFTFSFGSAFALPSDSVDTEYAGVEDAKAAALEVINAVNADDYSGEGKINVLGAIAGAKEDLKSVTTIGEVTDLVENFEEYIEAQAGFLNTAVALQEAVEKAFAQVGDLNLGVYDIDTGNWSDDEDSLFGMLYAHNGGALVDDEDAKTFDADFAALETEYMAFETKLMFAYYEGLGTVAEVEEATEEIIAAAGEFALKYLIEADSEIPQDIKDIVVKMIEDAADEAYDGDTVNTETHSAAVVKEFNAAIKAAVAAVKAAKTWDELADVVEKYVGADTQVTNPVGNEVVIDRDVTGLFTILKAKDLVGEVKIAAAKKVLAAIGEYNYKDINKGEWEDAEAAREEIEAVAGGDVTAIDTALDDVDTLVADSDKDAIKDAVDTDVEDYEAFLRITGAKTDAVADLETIGDDMKDSGDYQNSDDEITVLVTIGTAAINAATTLEDVEAVFEEYKGLLEAIPSDQEIAAEEYIKTYGELVDEYVASKIEDEELTLSADVKKLVDAVVEAVKAEYAAQDVADIAAAEPAAVDADHQALLDTALNAGKWTELDDVDEDIVALLEPTYDAREYLEVEDELLNLALDRYTRAVGKATSYTAWLSALATYKETADAIPTTKEVEYLDAVEAAEKAIDKLGTPEFTKAYKKLLDAAEEALGAVSDKAAAVTDTDFVAANPVKNEAKYDEADYEYAYLEYLDGQTAEESTTSDIITEFYDIAAGIQATGIIGCYDKAAQAEIRNIISNAYAAIRAAKTVADKEAVAEDAIAKLDAVEEEFDNTEYVERLALVKEEAAAYFKKYYDVAFASEATTQLQLAKDIIAQQDSLINALSPEEEVEYVKAYLHDMEVYARSAKTEKGNTRITAYADVAELEARGYKIVYRFFKSEQPRSGYKRVFENENGNTYTNTLGEYGTMYYYKFRVIVKDAEGETVAATPITQCKYANRRFARK